MTRKVHIAVMAYGGAIPPQSVACALTAVMGMIRNGWDVSYSPRAGDSVLPRARNAAVADFMADEKATDLVFMDADTYCDGNDLIKLISHDVDMVGAPYRSRAEPLTWNSVRWKHGEDWAPDARGLLEVDAVGTGLVRIRRTVFEQMIPMHAGMQYGDATNSTGKAYPLFWFDVLDGVLYGEDVVFCHKWKSIGGKVYIDPSINTGHIGVHAFEARLSDWCAQQQPEMKIEDITGQVSWVKNSYATLVPQIKLTDAA